MLDRLTICWQIEKIVNASDEEIVAASVGLTEDEAKQWVDLIDTMLPHFGVYHEGICYPLFRPISEGMPPAEIKF